MTALAIPEAIVGDTDTICERRDFADEDLASLARCLGRSVNRAADAELVELYIEKIATATVTRDLLNEEVWRRRVGYALARADQPHRSIALERLRSDLR